MKKYLRLTGLVFLLGLSISASEPVLKDSVPPDNAVHVTIIYDNYQLNPDLAPDWGFACLVEYKGEKLLFDAGRNPTLYQKNVELLKIDPKEIPTLFISHEHGDHTAGIPWLTEANPSIKCILPAAYAEKLKAGGTLPPNSEAVKKPVHLYGAFYSTGDDFPAFREQGLVIKTEQGGVLITGCGHPGSLEMLRTAEQDLGIEINTLIGGLHLMSASDEDLKLLADSLKEMGIRQICATHCTGDKSIAFLKEAFKEGYIPGGTGKEIIIP